ncbi:EAL domain-containing protein [Vibrio natriegens]|uniref:sensor domain-containing phosphodiesterase n=1 Tax=Vibrio natriegens TaxID=691 RepID=UPI003DA08F77
MRDSAKIALGRVQPKLNHTTVIEWSYNHCTREYECDQRSMDEVFGFQSFEDMLDQMSSEQRENFQQQISEVDLLGGEGHFSCCLASNEIDLVCATMNFEKVNDCVVRGTVTPLMSIAGGGEQAKILETLFDLPNVGVLIADANANILGCNRAFELQMGYRNSDLIGLKTEVFRSSHHSQSFYAEIWNRIEKDGYWSGNLFSRTASGGHQAHHLYAYRLNFQSGRVLFLGFSTDISASLVWMKNRSEQARDWFSFLPTKDQFENKLEHFARESGHQDLNIIMTLRPNFSQNRLVEQQLGFADFITRSRYTKLAGQLTRNVFVVCLQTPRCQWLSTIKLIEVAMKGFFTELKSEMGTMVHDTIVEGQTGVSVLGYDTSSPKKALALAVQTMVSSKVGEGGYFNFYNSTLHTELLKRQHLEAFLQKKIDGELVDVYFQPIVDTYSGKVIKFEALARFHHENSSYTTQEMISVIEDLELIAELDDMVCRIALERWSELQGFYDDDVGLSINRSLNTKLDVLQVLQRSLDLIKSSSVNPELVTLELTESAYFEQDEAHTQALMQIRQEGIKIAIDDFGTGYASFSYLGKGQFDLLKIDRKFVADIHEGSSNYYIVKMITELAHQLGVKVIAEGIEQVQERRILADLGVDYLQGYLFSPAVPATDLKQAKYCQSLFSLGSG